MKRRRSITDQVRDVCPYPQESLLIDAVSEMTGQRLICTSLGLAQFAGAVSRALPNAAVTCTYLDLYRANLAAKYWSDKPPNMRIECAADLTDEKADVVAFPFSAGGESELTREFIRAGHERLQPGGRMYCATENQKDTWLGEQLQKIFCKLERRAFSTGVLYAGTKADPLKKLKHYSCEFAFRDRGRLIRAYSRPGVFSHRHIDPGARHLIEEMKVGAGARVLDIGCGVGVVALAAACRADGVVAHAVDSNARAVQCTQYGAELNGLTNVTTELNADGNVSGAGQFDLALANPPYYAGFRIARHFLDAGRAALRPDGRMLVVTKQPDWYQRNMPEWFDDLSCTERKGYVVFNGVRREGTQDVINLRKERPARRGINS
jgi:16S rRNA (guanine1207-N2)-methyltransferase